MYKKIFNIVITILCMVLFLNTHSALAQNTNVQNTKNQRNSHGLETYYWISQVSTLPIFVAHDYKGLDRAAAELGVKVQKAGPTDIDLAGLISAFL